MLKDDVDAEALPATQSAFNRHVHARFETCLAREELVLTDGKKFTFEYAEPILLLQMILILFLRESNLR